MTVPGIDWRAMTSGEFQEAESGCRTESERRSTITYAPGEVNALASRLAAAVTGVDCTDRSITPPPWQPLATGWPPQARVTHKGRVFTNTAAANDSSAINTAEPSVDCTHGAWIADPIESTEGETS